MRPNVFVQKLGHFDFNSAFPDPDGGVGRFDKFVRAGRISPDHVSAELSLGGGAYFLAFSDTEKIQVSVASCQTPGAFLDRQDDIYLVYPYYVSAE